MKPENCAYYETLSFASGIVRLCQASHSVRMSITHSREFGLYPTTPQEALEGLRVNEDHANAVMLRVDGDAVDYTTVSGLGYGWHRAQLSWGEEGWVFWIMHPRGFTPESTLLASAKLAGFRGETEKITEAQVNEVLRRDMVSALRKDELQSLIALAQARLGEIEAREKAHTPDSDWYPPIDLSEYEEEERYLGKAILSKLRERTLFTEDDE